MHDDAVTGKCGFLLLKDFLALKNECVYLYLYVSGGFKIFANSCIHISIYIQSTPDNSNLQGKSKKVRVIGSSSYRELEENSWE